MTIAPDFTVHPLILADGTEVVIEALIFESYLYLTVLDGSEELIADAAIAMDPATISRIQVAPTHVRRGIATAMYTLAVSMLGPVAHSPERTRAGQGWANAVGGSLPVRQVSEAGAEDFSLWAGAMDDPSLRGLVTSYFLS